MIKINHKWLDVSQIQPGITSAKSLEIIQLLAEDSTVFEYRNFGEFNFEIQLRNRVIAAAIALDKSDAEFSTLEESESNKQYWRLSKGGTFTLQPGILPHAALVDIFINGRLYAFECGTAMVVTFLKAILDLIGPRNFDNLFSKLVLYDWHPPQNMALDIHQGRDYLPGDCVYFKNPDHDEATPEWQGENAILLGNNLFYGHGIGITSSQGIIAELNSNRKPFATISAFLTTHIIFLDSSFYSQFQLNIPRAKPDHSPVSLSNCIVSEIGSNIFLS
ncbi:protein-glutamine gamma-glutamyltransferase [Peribacillus sp. YIM B13472]|uniref:Protein-glutamine gamma-glutamyltransferase n=1 Tax=Peribacillus simplex TaxID=1478 RepID=A0A9W4KVI3_9BACI|nr:protein-glutamine gamma-glutamyltransferase [Peribacillus simplex]WHX90109.1 protein-glutamine gamma-glutamyltransferase [Peribacillus simplex]CAH0210067.1 Protein-glutamine gamma-glutamyltransferase [Peribacillus simplex]